MGQQNAKAIPVWRLEGLITTPSFHGTMGKWESETKLKRHGGNCYLTRYNKRKDNYKLSVMKIMEVTREPTFAHFTVIIVVDDQEGGDDTRYRIEGAERFFDSILNMLEFYQRYPLNNNILSIGIEVRRKNWSVPAEERECAWPSSPDNGNRDGNTTPPIYPAAPEQSPVRVKVMESLHSRRRASSLQRDSLIKQIHSHPSYHGHMKRITANSKLKHHGGSCYLTRYSTTRSVYVLSTQKMVGPQEHHSRRTTAHFNIIIAEESSSFKLEGTKPTFQGISTLYEHYQNAPLGNKIDGIGEYIRSRSLSTSSSSSGVSIDEEIEINFDVAVPKLDLLTLIRWKDHKSHEKKLEIIETVSSQWFKIGRLLGLSLSQLDDWKRDSSNIMCCSRVFDFWINSNGHLNYPLSWGGLEKLLCDIGHARAADKLKKALASLGLPIA